MDWPFERDGVSFGCSRLVTSMSVQKIGKLSTPQCAVLVCDLQERFKDVITGFETVVDTSRRMVQWCAYSGVLRVCRLARKCFAAD